MKHIVATYAHLFDDWANGGSLTWSSMPRSGSEVASAELIGGMDLGSVRDMQMECSRVRGHKFEREAQWTRRIRAGGASRWTNAHYRYLYIL
jgi:hypothetical protein